MSSKKEEFIRLFDSLQAFTVFATHTHAVKDLSEKEIQKRLQQVMEHSTQDEQQWLTADMKLLNSVTANTTTLRTWIMARMHGEQAVLCMTACWQAYAFQRDSDSRPQAPSNAATATPVPAVYCCFSGKRIDNDTKTAGRFLSKKDGATLQVSPAFVFHTHWKPTLDAVMLVSRAADFVLSRPNTPEEQQERIYKRINQAALFIQRIIPHLYR